MRLTKIAIALAAVLAMSVVVVSSAMAQPLTSNPGVNKVNLHGVDTENHKFTVDGQNVTCNESKFNTGEISVPANTLTMNAVYTGCTAFGFAGATVNMGNCHYHLTTAKKLETDLYTVPVDVNCETKVAANNTINVKSSVFGSECEASIGQNTETEHIIVQNTTNNVPKDISANITVNKIKVTKNKDNGLCPLSGTGTVENGSYNGTLTITDNGKNDIWVE